MIAPSLLVCGFGPFPGFPDNPAAQVVQRLEAERWNPPGVAIRCALMPATWAGGCGLRRRAHPICPHPTPRLNRRSFPCPA